MVSESVCPSVEAIVSYIGGRPTSGDLEALEIHFDACSTCARVVIEAAGTQRTGRDRAERARPRIFQPGQLIAGRYEIVAFLGAGGMGEVYEVQDRELGERVALKTVSAAISLDPAAVTRFKAEAQLARKVTHRNVCRVFDLGIDVSTSGDAGTPSATPFLTMELIRGRSLSDHIRAGDRFSPDEMLAIAREIARGLEAAHEAGVLHRDLKCDNILLAPRASRGFRPVITDFGLAAAATGTDAPGRTWSSRTPPFYGTRPYIAPERLAGALDTPSSDIYSLGVVMYELVTGSLRARAFAPASFEALPTKTPMAAVIYRCLQSQPARRPTNASEILLALDHEPGTEPPGVRPRRRRTISWVLAAAGASVALILALFRSGNGHSPGVEGIVTATAASPAPVERPSVDRIVALSRAISAAPASAQLKRHARAPFRRTKAAPSPDATRENSRNFLESAEARLRAGRIEEACVEGRAAATQSPALPESWEFLGRCYMRLGEPAEARTYYRRYLDLAPDGNNAVFIRAMLGESDL